MREILFRGQSYENGNWIYGNLIRIANDYIDTCQTYIFPFYNTASAHSPQELAKRGMVRVNPRTVGQWTGCVDKGGTKIFEGDKVECDAYTKFSDDERVDEGEFDYRHKGTVEFKNGAFTELLMRSDCEDSWYSFGTTNIEVVGNIYDEKENDK